MISERFPLQEIINAINEQGGIVYLVGGAVRDLLLAFHHHNSYQTSATIKDLDIEVHGLSLDALEKILQNFGPVNLVGKSFGVLRLKKLDVDWALPRADLPGRKPVVFIDPFMSMKEAFARRDLTMNAIGINLITFELVDPFGGYSDIQQGILRVPDATRFIEDPLRFYRVMQFIGRFEMKPDDQLDQLCKVMDISNVSRERIEEEFKKLLLKSQRPSLGIRWLDAIGRLKEILPELAAIKNVPQDPVWHPEGEVLEHTLQALDAAASLSYHNNPEKLMVMYAALCHDLGKASTTKEVDGVLKSHGHAELGAVLSKKMLKHIMNNKELIKAVVTLVRYHMLPIQFIQSNASPAAYKRLAKKLAPEANLGMLAKVAYADKQGRNPQKYTPLQEPMPDIDRFIAKSRAIGVYETVEQPVLQGRDLMPEIEPGPIMGTLVRKAYEIQLNTGVRDKEELKKRVLQTIIKAPQ